MQMSSKSSRQTLTLTKGNHRRIMIVGKHSLWGCMKDIQHSFERRGAITCVGRDSFTIFLFQEEI
jgi:hypothetical protein